MSEVAVSYKKEEVDAALQEKICLVDAKKTKQR